MSAAASVEVGGVMRGSRIPVKRGSSVRYEAVKSLQAGLGSRIPVRQGTSMRQGIVKSLVKTAVLVEGSWIRVEKDTRVRYRVVEPKAGGVGSRIPVVKGSSVQHRTIKSKAAVTGSRIPVTKGSEGRSGDVQIATAATPALVKQSRVKTACPAVPAVKKSLAAERIEARKVRVAKRMGLAPALKRAAKRGKTAKVKPDAADSSSESAAGSSSEGSAASSDEEGSVTDKSDTSSELSSEFGVQGGSFITTVKPDAAGPTTMPVAEVEWWEELDEEEFSGYNDQAWSNGRLRFKNARRHGEGKPVYRYRGLEPYGSDCDVRDWLRTPAEEGEVAKGKGKGKSVRFAYNQETEGPVTDTRFNVRYYRDLWQTAEGLDSDRGEESWAAKECDCEQAQCFCDLEDWEEEMKRKANAEWEFGGEVVEEDREVVMEEAATEEELVAEEVARVSINEGDAAEGDGADGGGEQQKPADDLDQIFASAMAGKFDDESEDEGDEGDGDGAGEEDGAVEGDRTVEDTGGGDAAVEDGGGGLQQRPQDGLDEVFASVMAGKFEDESDDECEMF